MGVKCFRDRAESEFVILIVGLNWQIPCPDTPPIAWRSLSVDCLASTFHTAQRSSYQAGTTGCLDLSAAMSTAAAAFSFPPLYSFKPFFTVQPTDATWAKQKQVWLDLIRSYCAHHKLYRISLAATSSIPTTAGVTATPAAAAAPSAASSTSLLRDSHLVLSLFRNASLDRQLSPDAVRRLLDALQEDGWGVWTEQPRKDVFIISPEHRLAELAELLFAHMEKIGEQAGISTVYELQNGDQMKGSVFVGMEEHLLLAVVRTLEAKGKCALIQAPVVVEMGVKFLG
jgi:ESCRT-II complex subunit VPS25